MIKHKVKTNHGKKTILVPERWDEVTVEQFQRIYSEWKDEDIVQAFSILSGEQYDAIYNSNDSNLEKVMYTSIRFLFETPMPFDESPIPMFLDFQVNGKAKPIMLPKHLGRLSIGQAIQARKSVEGVNDLRSAISIVTSIYLQPLLDQSKYDHLRAIEIEQQILKMPAYKIYPIGFFLSKRLYGNENWLMKVLDRLRHIKSNKTSNNYQHD